LVGRRKTSARTRARWPRLTTERLGPLPLVNEFLDRLDLDARSSRFVPRSERVRLPHAVALGALLRSCLSSAGPSTGKRKCALVGQDRAENTAQC